MEHNFDMEHEMEQAMEQAMQDKEQVQEITVQDVLRDGIARLDSFTYKGDEVERFAIQIRTVIKNLDVCIAALDKSAEKENEKFEKEEGVKEDADTNAE